MENNAILLPESILEGSKAAMGQLLPGKSMNRYMDAYKKFLQWRTEQKTESLAEEVFLAYFESASQRYKPTTLWSMYSMIKKTVLCNHNVNIATYQRLGSFLKAKMHGYETKKAAVFETEDIGKFLLEAPECVYLAIKAVAAFGLSGGCRGDEIIHALFENVVDTGREIVVRIPETKTYVAKIFPVTSKVQIDILRRYIALRPNPCATNRFFILQRAEKCCGQPIGKNTIAMMAQKIAAYLKLANPKIYTGHSFRRTASTVAANAGLSTDELKRFFYWQSDRVAERYVQDSLGHKRKMSTTMTRALNMQGDSVYGDENDSPNSKVRKLLTESNMQPGTSSDSGDANGSVDQDGDANGSVDQDENLFEEDAANENSSSSDVGTNASSVGVIHDAGGKVCGNKESHVFDETFSLDENETAQTIALSQNLTNKKEENSERHTFTFKNCKNVTVKFGKSGK